MIFNSFAGLSKDGFMTAGGGAKEIELARQVLAWAKTHPGLEQYSINKFVEALEIIPRVGGQAHRGDQQQTVRRPQ